MMSDFGAPPIAARSPEPSRRTRTMNARARAPAGAVCVVGGAALLPAQDTGTWCLGGVSRCALVPRGGHISAAGGDNKRGR